MAKLFKQLYLRAKSCDFKDLDILESLLSLHDFLLFRDEI